LIHSKISMRKIQDKIFSTNDKHPDENVIPEQSTIDSDIEEGTTILDNDNQAVNEEEECDLCSCVVCTLIIGIMIWFATSTDEGSGYGGGYGGGSCFPAGERILLADLKSEVPIEKIQPGSTIHQGGRVTAVMKLANQKDQLYRYNNSVFVTGSHLVEENGAMMYVGESTEAMQVHDFTPDVVFNLITSGHKIIINSTTFSDWEEEEDCVESWYLEKALLQRLNNGRFDHQSPDILLDEMISEGAFEASTPILLKNGSSVPIQFLQPEDELAINDPDDEPNRVSAVMQLWVPSKAVAFSYKDMIVTEWTIVLDDDGFWRNVKFSRNASALGLAENYGTWYQLWTTTHKVPVTNRSILFADYHVLDEDDSIFVGESCE